ncbi:MAG: hypothetical protein ACM3U2_14875 [Deltaproteobacteria bacterium]
MGRERSMAQNVLGNAVDLLRQYYGSSPHASPPEAWLTLVRIVLKQGGSATKGRDGSWIDESPLRTPEETARLTRSRLMEIFEGAGQKSSHAGALPALAQWWLSEIGDEDAAAAFAARPLDAWQEELRAIRGVSWELADRILLFVGGLAVYPLDRGSRRIAARHGWMDLSAEYDDWQAFFIGGLRDTDVGVADVSIWNSRLGRDFCGARAKCEECPLKGLLPEGGPVLLEGDD